MKATYVKTNLKTIVSISKIVTIHYYEFDRNFVFEGEVHDFWELVYVDKGAVEIQRDEELLTLRQGEIAFHRPDEFHAIRAFDSDPNVFVISFVCDSPVMKYLECYHTVLDQSLKIFISSILKEAKKTYILPMNDPFLERLIKKEHAPIGGEQLIKLSLEQLLIFLIRGITQKETPPIFSSKESMEGHLATTVKELIEKNIDKPFRVNDICATLGYSKSYLSKIFHEQSGETIAGYATTVRITRAKELIRNGNHNFSEISDMLAFDNPQYFSRVFKRITGMSPTEFRRSLQI